jgi:hypothetical protein
MQDLKTGQPVRDPEYGTRMDHLAKDICPSAMGYHNQVHVQRRTDEELTRTIGEHEGLPIHADVVDAHEEQFTLRIVRVVTLVRMDHLAKDICPSAMGYHNQGHDSYDPKRELFFMGINHIHRLEHVDRVVELVRRDERAVGPVERVDDAVAVRVGLGGSQDRPAGARSRIRHPDGPPRQGHLPLGDGLPPVGPVERVDDAVAVRVGQQLAGLAVLVLLLGEHHDVDAGVVSTTRSTCSSRWISRPASRCAIPNTAPGWTTSPRTSAHAVAVRVGQQLAGLAVLVLLLGEHHDVDAGVVPLVVRGT